MRGRLRVSDNGAIRDLGPGDSITIPANTPHAYTALEPQTEAHVVFSSQRPVAFFDDLHGVTSIPEVLKIAAGHDVVAVGPPLAGTC